MAALQKIFLVAASVLLLIILVNIAVAIPASLYLEYQKEGRKICLEQF